MKKLSRTFHYEQASGVLMVAAIALALVAANSPLAPLYRLIHDTAVHFRFGALVLQGPLVHWINQGLLVIFFLLVGLEIKRQFLEGHLSTRARAALPGFAAFGGMIVPAAIYVGVNWGDAAAIEGWAVPMATDIVLAVGLLSLLGRRVPTSLKIFLTTLAIFDDIGAVLIIALFYGDPPSVAPLLVGMVAIAALVVINRLGFARRGAYVAAGAVLWVAMLKAGIEAALAGVIIALAIPLRAPGRRHPRSPLRTAERHLHPWNSLLVVPVFAFFNAGIVVDADAVARLLDPVPLGIAAGLFLGKQIGIFVACRAAVAAGLGQLPKGVTWMQVYGVALIAGIGFTMSLFVATLAFADPAVLTAAKLAVLIASALAAVAGLTVIARASPQPVTHDREHPGGGETAAAARGS